MIENLVGQLAWPIVVVLFVVAFYFAARNEKLLLMRERFRNVARNGRDFPLVFVTEHGDESEDLLGVVSVWDVVEKE